MRRPALSFSRGGRRLVISNAYRTTVSRTCRHSHVLSPRCWTSVCVRSVCFAGSLTTGTYIHICMYIYTYVHMCIDACTFACRFPCLPWLRQCQWSMCLDARDRLPLSDWDAHHMCIYACTFACRLPCLPWLRRCQSTCADG